MTVRNAAFQRPQIALETVRGTKVNADISLRSIGMKVSPNITTKPFRPAGSIVPSVVPLISDMTQVNIESSPTYEEIGYIFASLLCKGTENLLVTTYAPTKNTANDPQTYSVEIGDSSECEAFQFGIVDSAAIKWVKDDFSLTGTMIGKKLEDATYTAGATAPTGDHPISPIEVAFSLGNDEGSLAAIELFNFDWSIGGRWMPVKPSGNAGNMTDVAEGALSNNSIKAILQANDTTKAQLTRLRAGNSTQVLKLTAADSAGRQLEIYNVVKIESINEFDETDGVSTLGVTYTLVDDPAFDYFVKAVVTLV